MGLVVLIFSLCTETEPRPETVSISGVGSASYSTCAKFGLHSAQLMTTMIPSGSRKIRQLFLDASGWDRRIRRVSTEVSSADDGIGVVAFLPPACHKDPAMVAEGRWRRSLRVTQSTRRNVNMRSDMPARNSKKVSLLCYCQAGASLSSGSYVQLCTCKHLGPASMPGSWYQHIVILFIRVYPQTTNWTSEIPFQSTGSG